MVSDSLRSGPPSAGTKKIRLSRRQLRAWKAIEAVVLRTDRCGRLKHPKLHGLWQWADTRGHVIYIQLGKPKSHGDYQGGRFVIEKLDPLGQRHVAAIWLSLPVIDDALVRSRSRTEDGFVRFAGLSKTQRYAEVLGHELAHAVWALGDPQNARRADDFGREAEKLYTRYRQAALVTALNTQCRTI